MEPLLDTTQAAECLGLVPQTLANWRCQGVGPRYVKLGARVRYRRTDVEAFVRAQLSR